MEHGPNAGETHADPAAGTFADLGARCAQRGLNVRQRRSAGTGSAKMRANVRRWRPCMGT
jgi:hypothetical protein